MIPTEVGSVELSTDEDWREHFEFFLQDDTAPNDLSDGVVVGALRLKTKGGEVRLDLEGDMLEVDGNAVTTNVDRLALRELPEGVYDFALRITRPGDLDEGLIRGKRQITHGATR